MTEKGITKSRKAIITTLKTKFGHKTSVKIEIQIYKMCRRLSEECDDTIEELYTKFAYEKIGCLFEAIGNENRTRVLKDIKNDVIGWDACSYDDFRARQDLDNQHLAEGIKVEKGEFPCRNKNCKSKECYYYQSQDRSADESATTYVVCTKCHTRYRFN